MHTQKERIKVDTDHSAYT